VETENQPQVVSEFGDEEVKQPEATPQPQKETEPKQPAAEEKQEEQPEVKPEKPEVKPEAKVKQTYTAEEVAKIQAEARKEAEQYKNSLAQLQLQQELVKAQQEEAKLQAKDKADVESGSITQEEAAERQNSRQEVGKLRDMIQRLTPHAEQLGRIQMANDLALEYGIKAEDLIKDKEIQNPMQMMRQATKLALAAKDEALRKATAKPETFDKGPGAGADLGTGELTNEKADQMPIEQYANHPSVKNRYK
jgi:hypothetical protein